jgi:hypothetical protein
MARPRLTASEKRLQAQLQERGTPASAEEIIADRDRIARLSVFRSDHGDAWYYLADLAEKGTSGQALLESAECSARLCYAPWLLRDEEALRAAALGLLRGAATCCPRSFPPGMLEILFPETEGSQG